MATTIYQAEPGALIPSGDRTVATYDSGLCRVDQVYVCASDVASTHRATLAIGESMPDGNDDPAIDGLYIFPAPQEIKRPGGFTEFHVSAYGRTVTGIQGVYIEQQSITNSVFSCNVWRISGKMVVNSSEAITMNDINIDSLLYDPFAFTFKNTLYSVLNISEVEQETSEVPGTATYTVNGQQYTVPYPVNNRRLYSVEFTLDGTTVEGTYQFWLDDPQIVISANRNFGSFTEIEITTEREGTTPVII